MPLADTDALVVSSSFSIVMFDDRVVVVVFDANVDGGCNEIVVVMLGVVDVGGERDDIEVVDSNDVVTFAVTDNAVVFDCAKLVDIMLDGHERLTGGSQVHLPPFCMQFRELTMSCVFCYT